MRYIFLVCIFIGLSSLLAQADIRPGQDINTVDAYMGLDGMWHINSTYYRFIKVTYSVTHVSLYQESGPSVHDVKTVILRKNENFSTEVPTKDTYFSVGIVKVEFPPSDQEPPAQDKPSGDQGTPSGNEGSPNDKKAPPNLNNMLTLKRTQASAQRALGPVFINGKFVCYFMETTGGQSLAGKGTTSSVLQVQDGGVTIAMGDNTEQLQFATSLTRDGNGGLTGVDASSSGQALSKVLSGLNFPEGRQEASLKVEITDFGSESSFEQ